MESCFNLIVHPLHKILLRFLVVIAALIVGCRTDAQVNKTEFVPDPALHIVVSDMQNNDSNSQTNGVSVKGKDFHSLDCQLICQGYEGDKYQLCIQACNPRLTEIIENIQYSSEIPGLESCNDDEFLNIDQALHDVEKAPVGGKGMNCSGLGNYTPEGFPDSFMSCELSCMVGSSYYGMKYDHSLFKGSAYDAITSQGLLAVPCLLEKIKDHTPTDHSIHYFSDAGNYRVGDIAYVAILRIIWINDIDRFAFYDGDINTDGYYHVFFNYLDDNTRRNQFYLKIKSWWSKRRDKLIYMKMPCTENKGYWQYEETFQDNVQQYIREEIEQIIGSSNNHSNM